MYNSGHYIKFEPAHEILILNTFVSNKASEEPACTLDYSVKVSQTRSWGAQWFSGRALDSRPKGSGFEPHRRHCVVVLEQDTFILA